MRYLGQLLMVFFLLFATSCAYSQARNNQYSVATVAADSFFVLKDFRKAADLYQKAFADNNGLGKVGHRYKLATCFALLNMPDSAFSQLEKIAGKGKFARYDMITTDSNFVSLHADPRWNSLVKTVEENRKKKVIIDN